MRGIDISENNGIVNWSSIISNGYQFAIPRIGYGRGNLDSQFYNNINGAIDTGLKVGVYHYSYALTQDHAQQEAEFVVDTLMSSGLTPDKLPLGVWFDMEDADGYKERHGVLNNQELTNLCSVFINQLWSAGYIKTGLYANLDWLVNCLYPEQLGGCAIWCAQYNNTCDYPGANIWQYTQSEYIEGKQFDANLILDFDV